MLRTTEYFRELQETLYREATSPWGLPLDQNSFKQLREDEQEGYVFGKIFSFLSGKSSRTLQNNNGVYFNLVCPPIIDSLDDIFKNNFRLVHKKIKPSKIVWGTLPDYDVNAKSIKKGDEIYIVLNESLLYLLYKTYRVLFYIMYSNSSQVHKGRVELRIEEKDFPKISKKYYTYFRELYSSFLFTGIARSERAGIPNNDTVNNATAHVFDTSIFFALAHEYTHVYFDHFDSKTESSEEMEKQADAIAGLSSLFYNAKKKYAPSFCFMSFQMFFAFAKFIGVIVDKSKDRHPEIHDRLYSVVGKCMAIVYKDDELIQRHYSDSMKYGNTIYKLLCYLWKQVEEEILSEYQRLLDSSVGITKQSSFSQKLGSISKYFRNEDTIEGLFERLMPFIRYILDDKNDHKRAIRSFVSTSISEDVIRDAVSTIFFRIQVSQDRTEEGQTKLAYGTFKKRHGEIVSLTEFRQIFNYIVEEFIKYIVK